MAETQELSDMNGASLVVTEHLPTRFRALALFGRRPAERVVGSVLPASENLHTM